METLDYKPGSVFGNADYYNGLNPRGTVSLPLCYASLLGCCRGKPGLPSQSVAGAAVRALRAKHGSEASDHRSSWHIRGKNRRSFCGVGHDLG